MDILTEIIENKRIEVNKQKREYDIQILKNLTISNKFRFSKSLDKNKISIIAEIKKKSPSAGIIDNKFDYLTLLKKYDNKNITAISVLTDEKYFGGNLEIFKKIRAKTNKPLLRKEFIIDNFQIYQSIYYKADIILLIAKILDSKTLTKFLEICNKYGIDAIVECHNKDEIKKAIDAGAKIIGINNRNLNDFSVDINNSLNLKKFIPDDLISISESGIRTPEDIKKIKDAGYNAVLVGESFVRCNNLKQFYKVL